MGGGGGGVIPGWIVPSSAAATCANARVKTLMAQSCLKTFIVSPEDKVAFGDSVRSDARVMNRQNKFAGIIGKGFIACKLISKVEER
jgi:hypothetical protein